MTTTPIETRDTIDAILGVEPGSTIAALREAKPELARQDQAYYLAIFDPTPASAAELSLHDRALVAVRVASHTRSAAVADWYSRARAAQGATANEIAQVRDLTNAWSTPTKLGAASATYRPAHHRSLGGDRTGFAEPQGRGVDARRHSFALADHRIRFLPTPI